MRKDERDTMFARMAYEVGSEEYKDYYSKNPEKKEFDDGLREKPNLCSEGTLTYDSLNSPLAVAPFMFLSDIKGFSEGEINKEKTKIEDIDEITEKIKGYAKFYGANLVGITKMEDEFYYSHRGRHKENYGEKIDKKDMLPYGIVFAVEMDDMMIANAPRVDEVIATSKTYVDVAIIGMVLAYYIRLLGYEARNHMDANYLVQTVDIAVSAGIGQKGRSNLLVTNEYGSRVRLGVVTTNLELKSDKPVDFGLDYFCTRCGICMQKCPGKAIPQKKTLIDGKEQWVVNQEKCYEKWRLLGTDCGLCIAKCPFSKKENNLGQIKDFNGRSEYIKEFMKCQREKEIPNTFKSIEIDWIKRASEK